MLTLLFPLVCLNGWLTFQIVQFFDPIVTPLVLAIVLTFVLNYPVRFLQRRSVQRSVAVGLVFLSAFLILAALAVTLIPILSEDVSEIAQVLPQWIDSGSRQLQALEQWAVDHHIPMDVDGVVNQLNSRLPDQLQTLADNAINLVVEAIGSVSEALLTAVLTFYLLLDGDRLAESIFQRFPGSLGSKIKQALQDNFENYFIGQVALASLVGVTLTIALLLFQIPYALLFGLGVGVLAVIPFGDTVSFTLISLLLAAQDFWLGIKVLAVAIVIDQVIDQLVAPRLLGRFTGLRPVWVLLALLVGTRLAGLLGLILAVPLTSSVKTLINEIFRTPATETGDRPTPSPQSLDATPATVQITQNRVHQ
jgi:predicted PurR-regulated permease PerM